MAGQGKTHKQSRTPYPYRDNPLEVVKDLGQGVAQSFKNDLLGEGWQDVLEQFGLRPSKKISGTLSPSETLNLAELEKQNQERPKQVSPVRTENLIVREETQEIAQKIGQIQWEIKQLIASSKDLAIEFSQVSMEAVPQNPGRYHLNFFEWLLSFIKKIREKVEDSQVWLAAFQSKKAKRGYWAMFKKQGTSFGLSNERVVATQTG